MSTPKIFDSEFRFCLIMWETVPIKCAQIAKICGEKLEWSRTTTYTVIKRLSERGVIKVENSVVTPLITKEEAQKAAFEELLEKRFQGSISALINAFSADRKLSAEDAAALKAFAESSAE